MTMKLSSITSRHIGLRACLMLSLSAALAGCSSSGDIDVTSGVGIRTSLDGCPIVAVPDGTGDITLFTPGAGATAAGIDIVGNITNVRNVCNDDGTQIYSEVSFDIMAQRMDTRGPRQVTLPYYSVLVQGGSSVVAKRVGTVTLSFADGQRTSAASAKAGGYLDANLTRLPADIRDKITRPRKAGDVDAAVDPLSIPEVKAAVEATTFEHLVGFQLTQEQLGYNVTR